MTYGVPGKTRLGDNPPTHAKANRSKGKGIQAPHLQHPLDSAEGGTAKVTRNTGPQAGLEPVESGHKGSPRSNVAGHAPDGSGRYIEPTFEKNLVGIPEPIVTQARPAVMNGDSDPRHGYHGEGRGPIKP